MRGKRRHKALFCCFNGQMGLSREKTIVFALCTARFAWSYFSVKFWIFLLCCIMHAFLIINSLSFLIFISVIMGLPESFITCPHEMSMVLSSLLGISLSIFLSSSLCTRIYARICSITGGVCIVIVSTFQRSAYILLLLFASVIGLWMTFK